MCVLESTSRLRVEWRRERRGNGKKAGHERARLCEASWTSVRTWAFSLSEGMVPGEYRVTYTN